MESIIKLIAILEEEREKYGDFDIRIPGLWEDAKNPSSPSVIRPAYSYFIDRLLAIWDRASKDLDYSKPYYKTHEGGNGGQWIKNSIVYSMLPRFSSALYPEEEATYKHHHFSFRGSFLKSILLLDMLNFMGVDTIYFLPIMERSKKNRKGDAGSCYAIRDFYKLDEDLKDELTGSKSSAELEFSAFLEAAHSYGMKLIIDIIPRTMARDAKLIFEHPDFFYWIKAENLSKYRSPRVPLQKKMEAANEKNLSRIFQSKEVLEHLKLFEKDPRTQNPGLYKKLQEAHLRDGETDFLELIEKEYGLIVAPAFSDCINDSQPAWSDITYLRLFLDHPALSQKYLRGLGFDPAPYILFDVAKASNVPGKVINRALWDMLIGIIPSYQKRFGIDGVRIDMGHALPKELLGEIMDAAYEADPNFCFIAEELDTKRAKLSKEAGYKAIVGDAFIKLNELEEGGYIKYIKSVKNKPLPIFSSAETHDTARLSSKEGGKKRARAITAASLFIPNSVGFINTLQELYEVQPMNLGIGLSEEDRYQVSHSDFNYGKLALFDYAAPAWDKGFHSNMLKDLNLLATYRSKYLNSYEQHILFETEAKTALSFFCLKSSILLVACNTDDQKDLKVHLKADQIKKGLKALKDCTVVYSSLAQNQTVNWEASSLRFELCALECLILEISR